MGLLNVAPAGLESLAAFCDFASAKVGVSATPTTAPGPFQPSAAAVKAIHVEAELTGQTLSARMLSTGVHMTNASAGFSAQDAEATTPLNELAVTT